MERKLLPHEQESYPQEQYAKEAEIRFDPQIVKESNKRYKSWSKEKLNSILEEGKRIVSRIMELMDRPVTDPEVQQLVRDYHKYMENYFHQTQQSFDGLAELYVIDEQFTAYYEKIKHGLAEYLSQAMHHYCNTEFKELTTHS